MKKLHSLAFYALVTPVMTLGASSLMAHQSDELDIEHDQRSTQSDRSNVQSDNRNTQSDRGSMQSDNRDAQSDRGNMQSDNRDAQSNRGNMQSDNQNTQSEQGTQRFSQSSDSQKAEDRLTKSDQSREENRGFLEVAPANGMQATNLIGADVNTSGDEDVGSVDDLIVDQNGQIVAIVVSVGGFLGMGEKDVAIGWDEVTTSNTSDGLISDNLELRIDMSRDVLRNAPSYELDD